MIKVFPIDWYSHFSKKSPICTLLSESLSEEVELVTKFGDADIILIGPYGDSHRKREIVELKKPWKLFVTGENRVPDLRYYHHSLSFCRFSFNGRNFRWPIWFQSLSVSGVDSGTFTPTETDRLLETNKPLFSFSSRTKWNRVVSVFNNCEPIRCSVFDSLRDRNIIDGVGTPFGNGLPWGDECTYRSKIDVLKEYGFNMCFENSISDGYYTEKLLHARASGCIPLIYSDSHIAYDFDVSSCINLYDYDSISDFSDFVHELTRDFSRCEKMASQPIFSEIPKLDEVNHFIRSSYQDYSEGRCCFDVGSFDNMKWIIEPDSLPRKISRFLRRLVSK
jgi:hypothetical protein